MNFSLHVKPVFHVFHNRMLRCFVGSFVCNFTPWPCMEVKARMISVLLQGYILVPFLLVLPSSRTWLEHTEAYNKMKHFV